MIKSFVYFIKHKSAYIEELLCMHISYAHCVYTHTCTHARTGAAEIMKLF